MKKPLGEQSIGNSLFLATRGHITDSWGASWRMNEMSPDEKGEMVISVDRTVWAEAQAQRARSKKETSGQVHVSWNA